MPFNTNITTTTNQYLAPIWGAQVMNFPIKYKATDSYVAERQRRYALEDTRYRRQMLVIKIALISLGVLTILTTAYGY